MDAIAGDSMGISWSLDHGRSASTSWFFHEPKVKTGYWRTQGSAEIYLPLFLKGRRVGVGIKRADAPNMTPSMGSALEDLELYRLLVVYPASVRYTLRLKVEAMSLSQCVAELT